MKKILSFVMILLVVIPLTMLTVFTPTSTVPTQAEINQAINLGMQWLAAQQNTTDGSWGTLNQVGKTGFAVLKFETHAMGIGEDALDPTYEYYDQVRNGLDYIFANASIIPISAQPGGDPDTDGDGFGVYFGSDFVRTYETSIAMMAIAASTHPEMVVDVLGSSVDGWTYEDVLQDAVDYLAFGQTDAGDGRGGWIYEEIDNGTSMSDNSNTGYAVLGLAYAEAAPPYGFALTIPAFVKSELNVWIDYIQNDPGSLDDGGEDDPDGGSGYVASNESVNILETGHLLCEMAFVGDTRTTQRVIDAVDYVVRHWNDTNVDPGWKGSPAENASYQAMYTTMTGLEALGIDEIEGIDWFDGFSDVLVAQQNPDGSWPPCIWDDGEQILATEWALLTLQKEAPLAHRWVIKAPLPELLEGAAGAVVEDKIYVLKGHSEMVGDTGDVRIYDPTTDSWSYGTPSPIVDAEFYQAGVVSGKIYVIGGRNTFTGNQEYDPLIDTWINKTLMPTGRAGHALAVVNDSIYVIGGRDGGEPLEGNVTNVVEAYDPSTDIWITGLTPMPTARSDTTAAVVNEKIYVLGGWNGTSILSTVEVYDPFTDTWSSRAAMPTQRADLGAVECSGHIHAIGGINATGNGINATQVSTHEIYDPATDTWSFAEPMPTPRAELVVVNVGGTIYAIGGGIYGESVDANEAYACMRAITWDFFYSADTLPDEDPNYPWILVEDFDNDTGVATVSGGILRLDTSSEMNKWSYQQVWSPDNSVGWTFEVRLKTQSSEEPYRDASRIVFHADGKWFSIGFFKDRTKFVIREGLVDVRYINNTYFRTYRICLKGAYLEVWVSGELFYTGAVEYTSPYNYIDFGDTAYMSYYGAVSHWDYLAWKYGYYPASGHDVAVTNVTPSKTVVGQEYCMNITVTVENQGIFTETFNVTAYYGNDTITPGQWKTFWSWGDVNRDGYINQTDVDIINDALGSEPSDPNWCPWADLNQDLVVDIEDIMIVTLHWWWNIWTHFISGAAIETQTVNNLPTGTSTTLVFTWNTTGVAKGNYTISAYAVPILYEEIDRADNNYGNGVVKVTIPGDDDGDGDVDASDLFDLSKAYGSEPEDDNWNPNCDINNDGKVDASDLFDQSRNYGKTI